MKRLIINADDLGWSEAVTGGILRAHREGVLTSTTLMTNLEGAEAALARARAEAPNLGIGIHLNLTEGRPLAPPDQVAPLVGPEGRFSLSLVGLFRAARRGEEVRRAMVKELEAQIVWAEQHGLAATHVDGHKHVQVHPVILPLVIDLARAHGLRAVRTTREWRLPGIADLLPREWGAGDRVRQWVFERVLRQWGAEAREAVRQAGLATADWFFGVRATGGMSAEVLQQVLRGAPAGTGEIMVHPGLADAHPPRTTRLDASRPREMDALCDAGVRRAVQEAGWTLATYKDVTNDASA